MWARYFLAATFLSFSVVSLAEAPPSPADIQQLLDSGDFHGAIAGSNRLLTLTGSAGGVVDRGLVFAMKAEALLQLKNYAAASEMFANAAKEEGDPIRAATDKADEILIHRSSAGLYVPRVAQPDHVKPAPIDILIQSTRPTAFPILFKDEWTAAQPELRQGKSAHDMGALLKLLEKAAMLHQLEIAATGHDVESKKVLEALSDHAYELMDSTLTIEDDRVTDIKAQAQAKVKAQKLETLSNSYRSRTYTTYVQHTRSAGLSSRLAEDLKGIISDCQKISPAADSVGKLAEVSDKKWAPIVAEADRISARAQDVLDADYDTADKHAETLLGK